MAVDLTMTSEYLWDTDISTFRPRAGFLIVACDEEEMLRIGNTNLMVGFFEDNRNNAHWFGDVISLGEGVPLQLGERVWFSYMTAKGMDRIRHGSMVYIFMEFCDIILVERDGIKMLNGNILSVPLPPKKHDFLELYETDEYYTEIRHVPSESAFIPGDRVHYWLNHVYELEGQRKLLKENYRVLREENIITKLVEGNERIIDHCVLVDINIPLEHNGIVLVKPIKRKIVHGKVIESTCEIAVGTEVFVKSGRGYKVGSYQLFRMEHVEAVRY
jgi:hypothetical protein